MLWFCRGSVMARQKDAGALLALVRCCDHGGVGLGHLGGGEPTNRRGNSPVIIIHGWPA
jgi:hypothetical protein